MCLMTLEKTSTQYYLLVVFGDVEPHLSGPYKTQEAVEKKAISHRKSDPQKRDGSFFVKSEVKSNGKISLSVYSWSNGFFDRACLS